MKSAMAQRPDWIVALLLPLWVVLYLLLQPLADGLVSLAALTTGERLTESVRFFLFEAPKVLLLLVLVIFAVGIVRSFFSPERTRAILAKRSPIAGSMLAGLLGIVTPFCSCSAVPLFIGFVESGVPLGATFSFLVAAPMINEVAVVLLFGLFGWKTALLYVGTGLAIAIGSGYVIGKINVGRFVEDWVFEIHSSGNLTPGKEVHFADRIHSGYEAVSTIVGKVWPYLLVGIGVGAAIHGYAPEDFLAGIMGKSVWWSVPVAVLIGVPLYSNAAGVVPILSALLEKGAALGTALAFMMSVIGLSLPETIILRKVLKPPLIGIFVGVVACGIIVVGFIFNMVY